MTLPRPSGNPRGMSLPGLLLLIVCALTLTSLGTMSFLQFGIWGVLIFALVVAGLIIFGLITYLIVRWFAGRKAASFEKQLSAPVASGGTADPGEAARREEFREKFKAGLKTLTDSGKNLTRFPLYVLVGEPGAGKTEAIRHSSIRFPQGINDLLQGVGGTYNMDWWFTNDAVILDTAGALLLEKSNKAKFEEFLELLKQYRPDYPITGLVLAIPADSLLVDGERGLEEKAGRIVEQFAVLQESLDLRYPVYVMVTKCDLITGFREFFDAPGNDAFESQMLGWSNPDPLDQPFEPSRTGRLLEPLAERLQRVRDQLLSADWPSGQELRRLDFLDAVYAFPGEFRRLFDPLGKYLEILFRPDHWKNQRPPFFRGIYFTSSLRQGAVLDQELAAALNMPVSRLPDVKGYQTDKSLFLRDFFLEKLFRESGLVTRLTNIAGGLRNRLMRFYLVTASVLLLLLLTGWFASQRLDKRLAAERNLWKLANQTWDNGTFLPMFERSGPERTWRYTGEEPVMNSEFTRLAYQSKLSEEVGKGLGWGTYFAPLPAYRQLKHDRERAQIVIVEGSIIRPLLQAVRENLRDSKRAVASEDEVAATLALVEIEAYLDQAKRLSDPEDIARLFNPLYRVAAPTTFATTNGNTTGAEIAKTLNGIISRAWEQLDDRDLDRMRWMAEGPPYRAIDRGMRLFTLHKTRLDQRQTESDEKTRLREEKAANFMRHEDELWTLRQNLDDFKEIETWLTSLIALGKELDEIGDPAAYAMRRATYAEHDARLRKLLPDLPSLLARDVGNLLDSAGNPDASWVAVEDKQRSFDPQSDTAIVWAAYLNPAEDGTPLYRKRLDALLKHFPLLNPEDELTRRFQSPDPGQLQAVFLSLAKLVEERAKIADAYPEAPQLPKEEADQTADPAKVRARAEAGARLQKRLAELSERGKVITEYLDQGTKDLLIAKYLDGPFNTALAGHQGLIFRKPFGNRDPVLTPTADFPRAAAVITALAGDFAACDAMAVDARHHQLRRTFESLRLRVGDRAVTKRSRFEIILQAKNAVADEGHAVRSIPVELGPFHVADLVEQKRAFKLMPPFVTKEEVVTAKGIRLVKVGRPGAEIGAKPDAKGAPLGELLLSDPVQVVVEWEDAEGRGNVIQGGPGAWGTLNFILARSGSSAAARRQVDVMDALGKKLTLFFTFPSAYPAGPRPTGFD